MTTAWIGIQFVINLLLGATLAVVIWRTRAGPSKRPDGDPPPKAEEIAELLDTFYQLIRELEAWDRRLSVGMEEKEKRVTALMRELDARGARLEYLLGQAVRIDPQGKGSPEPQGPPTVAAPPRRETGGAPEGTALPGDGDGSVGDRYDQVLRLAGGGLGVEEIASKVRMSREEISLILDLKRKSR